MKKAVMLQIHKGARARARAMLWRERKSQVGGGEDKKKKGVEGRGEGIVTEKWLLIVC